MHTSTETHLRTVDIVKGITPSFNKVTKKTDIYPLIFRTLDVKFQIKLIQNTTYFTEMF